MSLVREIYFPGILNFLFHSLQFYHFLPSAYVQEQSLSHSLTQNQLVTFLNVTDSRPFFGGGEERDVYSNVLAL